MPNSSKIQSGFSMIEVLISLVILAGGLLALAKFQGSVTANEGYNKQKIQAAHISQLVMDKMRVRANELVKANPTILVSTLKTDLSTFSSTLATTMNADASTDNSIAKTITPNTEYSVQVSYPTTGLTSAITNIAIPVQIEVSWNDYGAGGCGKADETQNCKTIIKTLISKDSQALF